MSLNALRKIMYSLFETFLEILILRNIVIFLKIFSLKEIKFCDICTYVSGRQNFL